MKIIAENDAVKVIVTIECFHKGNTKTQSFKESACPAALECRQRRLMNRIFDVMRKEVEADQVKIIK
jgi:hypothetical protein